MWSDLCISRHQLDRGRAWAFPGGDPQVPELSNFGSPYAALNRSTLYYGVRFGDEHINNIIYQALTIPTFRLVIFVDPALGGEVTKLRALDDPRIWIIGSDEAKPGRNAHYFDTIVEEFMPQRPSERIDDAVKKVFEAMIPKKKDDGE